MTPSSKASVKPLRIGLLVNSSVVQRYDAEFIDWAATQDDIEVTHLLVHKPQIQDVAAPRKSLPNRIRALVEKQGFKATVAGLVWGYIYSTEKRLLAKNDELLRNHLDTVDVADRVPDQLRITPNVSPSGFVYRFSEQDINAVKALDLDLMIRCGDGILRGDILSSSRFGVLSFHHGDNRVNRGGPPAFWEVYYKQDKTSFTCLLYTSPSPRDATLSRMPSSA